MYTITVPYKDFLDKPRTEKVHFNLTEREVFKLLVEFQAIFEWQERMQGDKRSLETSEVVEFYTNFETILLEAWGEPSEDGKFFRKTGRYDFEESALFSACMVEFISNPGETTKLLDGLMPKGLQEMVKKADANLSELAKRDDTSEDLRRQIAALQAQVESKNASN